MTRRERVIQALNHNNTDIIPYNINFTQQEKEKVATFLGDENFKEKIGNHMDMCAFNCFMEERPSEEPGRPGYFRDEFGVMWNRNGADKDIGVIDEIVIKDPDIGLYRFPEVKKELLHKQFQQLSNNGKDTFKLGGIGFCMYERAWTLRGIENFLMDMITEPDFANELLDAICEYNLQIIDIGLSYDIDAFHFGDDWGQQSGLIMGPKLWRKFIKPRMARMYERVKSKGKFVSQHSCGDIHEILPDLIDIGLDLYQTFQPEIYDIRKVKKEYGQHLSFWGGISTQRLLPFATPDEVKAKAKETMQVMAESGGYVAAPTHDIPGDVPPENVAALIEVFQKQ